MIVGMMERRYMRLSSMGYSHYLIEPSRRAAGHTRSV